MAEAQRFPDMTRVPVQPGGVMTRHESGQITTVYPKTCPSGHPIEQEGQKFCTTCGDPIASPELGGLWADDTLAQERRQAEGTD
jgi:hypothetical protein